MPNPPEGSTAAGSPLRVAVHDGVATLTLDSPGNRNALSARMRAALLAALQQVAADSSVRVVVLDHTGPAFCAGMDLKETAVEQPGREGVRELPAILRAIAQCPQPVIARVAGTARAGGVGVMAACDIVVCSPEVTFSFSEVRIGVIPAVISIPVLARMQPVVARELFLTGAVLDAQRARETGLVNAVAPDAGAAALDELVAGYVADLARGGPTALAGTKALTRAGTDLSDEAFAPLLELSARQFSSNEAREGARAFAERRPPAWVR